MSTVFCKTKTGKDPYVYKNLQVILTTFVILLQFRKRISADCM